MPFPQDSVLPQGSLILVTGVTGFIASTIADQLLQHGFRVRGTARDPNGDKASWMSDFFEKHHGNGKFELVQVEDMAKKGCLDSDVKGCDGFIHVASVVNFATDPNEVIPPSIAFVENALAAAEREPSIKRFVLTSSSSAVSMEKVNEVYDITDKTWADWAVKEAWRPPPYTTERALTNYRASKVLAEQKLWDYVKRRKPHFVVNSVLPDFNIGLPICLEKQGYMSSMSVFKQMFEDSGDIWRAFGPQWCIDVVDTALLHIAGLICPDAKNQRIFGYGHRKTWTDFIQRLQKMYPEHKFPEPRSDEGHDLSNIVGRDRAEDLLRWMGKPGWRPLDDMLREASEPLAQQQTCPQSRQLGGSRVIKI